MKDPNPQMRIQAIRASETLFKSGDRSLLSDYRAMTLDADTDVAIQALKARKSPTVISGVKNALFAGLGRLMPRKSTVNLMGRMVTN